MDLPRGGRSSRAFLSDSTGGMLDRMQ
jgi:hypothetical protein